MMANNFNNPFRNIFPQNSAQIPGSYSPDYLLEINEKLRTTEPIGEYIPVRFKGQGNVVSGTRYFFTQFGEMKFGVINVVILNDIMQDDAKPLIFRVNGRSFPFNIPTDDNLVEMNVPLMTNTTIEITYSPVGGIPQYYLDYDIRGYYYNK